MLKGYNIITELTYSLKEKDKPIPDKTVSEIPAAARELLLVTNRASDKYKRNN